MGTSEDPDPRTQPEHIKAPEHPPAFKSSLGVDTGIEVGIPVLAAGVACCFFAFVVRATELWILGGALAAIGLIVMLRNRRL
ncbi:MAG: hypothetical protein QOG62_1881 [Thermoleophilaceae bacterium]|nr:hypothetical protein [Thermoleophilaceae bacterium]